MAKGYFIISLDYELMWGVRDKKTVSDYGHSIVQGQEGLLSIVKLLNEFSCTTTIATVGFLFMKDNIELKKNIPTRLPKYDDVNLTPYPFIQKEVELDSDNERYYFSYDLTSKLKKYDNVEIATHTYSHYYCLESGPDIETFEEDIIFAIKTANKEEVMIKSIVFPRNQFSVDHINICEKHGITSYRGNPKHWIYRSTPGKDQHFVRRIFRLLDTYINLTGHHCADVEEISSSKPYNIPASRFLKPYQSLLSVLERIKLYRIKRSMSYAAKKGKVYHLWWHPHNFGKNTEKNLQFLNKVLIHYKKLSETYGFQSITMDKLSDKIAEEG